MKVFVTGATGFVGGAVIQALAKQGTELHALARPSSDRQHLADLPIHWHIGDITDRQSLRHLFTAADWVIHSAGILGQAGVPETTYQRINGEGTRNVLAEVAQNNGRCRVLCLSSAGVLGPYHGQGVPDEYSPLAPSNPYERSKVTAENYIRQFASEGLDVVTVRPEFIYGPGDMHVLGLFKAIQRRIFFYVGDGHNCCHPTYIDDTVAGLLRCLQQGKAGEIYHIAGPRSVSFRELAETIATAVGVSPPRLALPKRLIWLGAAGVEFVGTRLSIPVPLSRTGVAFFSENRHSTYAKAQRELNYEPQVDLEEGIAKAVTWYRLQGLLT